LHNYKISYKFEVQKTKFYIFTINTNNFSMQKLTNKEEEIMHILWKLKKAFVKDVLAEIVEDKPHYNTLSTIIRNLEEKGYVAYKAYGKTHQYYPLISKEVYKKRFMSTAIENYFNSSYKNVVSFFAKEEKISVDELKEIIALIEKNPNHKK